MKLISLFCRAHISDGSTGSLSKAKLIILIGYFLQMPIIIAAFVVVGIIDILIMRAMMLIGVMYSIINITGMVIYGIIIFRRVETLRKKREKNESKSSLLYNLWRYKV